MSDSNPSGKRAVVTGAAGGLGSCYAEKLAQRGYDLLLIDRPGQPLETLADELSKKHAIEVRCEFADLADDEQVAALARQLEVMPDIDLLVNNAGFGHAAYFVDIDIKLHLEMIKVHILTPVRLSRAVLPGMMERNRGAVINIASLCAWTPAAGVVQYSATKAYLVAVSKAIQDELRGTDVRIQALCPGFVQTGFFGTERMTIFDPRRIPGFLWVTRETAVECSLKSLRKRRVVVIPGFFCRVIGRLMQMPISQPIVQAVVREKRHP